MQNDRRNDKLFRNENIELSSHDKLQFNEYLPAASSKSLNVARDGQIFTMSTDDPEIDQAQPYANPNEPPTSAFYTLSELTADYVTGRLMFVK